MEHGTRFHFQLCVISWLCDQEALPAPPKASASSSVKGAWGHASQLPPQGAGWFTGGAEPEQKEGGALIGVGRACRGSSGALTQPQQEKQEGGQNYPVVLLDQRVLSPAGWQQSRKSVDTVTGGPPPPVGTLPHPQDRGGVAGAACVGAGAVGGGIRAESHLQQAL